MNCSFYNIKVELLLDSNLGISSWRIKSSYCSAAAALSWRKILRSETTVKQWNSFCSKKADRSGNLINHIPFWAAFHRQSFVSIYCSPVFCITSQLKHIRSIMRINEWRREGGQIKTSAEVYFAPALNPVKILPCPGRRTCLIFKFSNFNSNCLWLFEICTLDLIMRFLFETSNIFNCFYKTEDNLKQSMDRKFDFSKTLHLE